MGENSRIGWTDHTFNYWEGCTKVSPACDFCYAWKRNLRFNDGDNWGAGAPRRLMSQHTRNNPYRWNRDAAVTGKRKVFCSSLSDWADNEIDPAWREDLFRIIRETRELRWLLLTKRIGNAFKMLPEEFPQGYEHVGLMATIANQEEADRDIPKLLKVKRQCGVTWVGLSCEPMLGPIELEQRQWLSEPGPTIDWVIVGGESGEKGKIRPFEITHAEDLVKQCQRTNTAVFVKQLGSKPTWKGKPVTLKHKKGEDFAEFPKSLQFQEFPKELAA